MFVFESYALQFEPFFKYKEMGVNTAKNNNLHDSSSFPVVATMLHSTPVLPTVHLANPLHIFFWTNRETHNRIFSGDDESD